jgi:hypothetical protein
MSDEYHGSMRMTDGSRVQFTAEEAKAIWDRVKQVDEERAAQMPTARDALSVLSGAVDRLKTLGWRDARYCPRDGSEFAVCEIGSTGMWSAFFHDDLIHYADCCSSPRGMFFKPVDKLSDDESELVKSCDQVVADQIGRMGDMFS